MRQYSPTVKDPSPNSEQQTQNGHAETKDYEPTRSEVVEEDREWYDNDDDYGNLVPEPLSELPEEAKLLPVIRNIDNDDAYEIPFNYTPYHSSKEWNGSLLFYQSLLLKTKCPLP